MQSRERAASDTDLLALGDRFDADLAKFISLDEMNSELGERSHALAWERSGADMDRDVPTREEVERFLRELGVAENELGWSPVSREVDRRLEKLIDLSKAIAASRASTIRELAVKARALAWHTDLCPPDEGVGIVTQTMH